MLRLIAVVVAVTCSLLPAAPVPKPTDRQLKARWGEIVKGMDGDESGFNRSSLTLTASPQKLGGCFGVERWHTRSKSIRTRSVVEGDFQVTVKLAKPILLDAGVVNRGPDNLFGAVAGLDVRDEMTVLLKTWQTIVRDPETAPLDCSWAGEHARGHWSDQSAGVTNENALWLRVRRTDGHVFVARSVDGRKWSEQRASDLVLTPQLADKVEIGIFVCPDVNLSVKSTFSDFKLTTGNK